MASTKLVIFPSEVNPATYASGPSTILPGSTTGPGVSLLVYAAKRVLKSSSPLKLVREMSSDLTVAEGGGSSVFTVGA